MSLCSSESYRWTYATSQGEVDKNKQTNTSDAREMSGLQISAGMFLSK